MKKLVKLVVLTSAFTLSANIANASDKIGFADPNYLVQNHPEMVATAAKIEQMLQEIKAKFADEEKKLAEQDKALAEEFKKIEEDAQKLQQEQIKVDASISKKMAALEKEAPRLRQKDIQARQSAINAEGKAFQDKVANIQKREVEFNKKADAFRKQVADLQQKMEKEQQDKQIDTAPIQQKAIDDVTAEIKKVAEAKGYTLVLNPSVAIYAKDEKADITDEVLSNIKSKVKPSENSAK